MARLRLGIRCMGSGTGFRLVDPAPPSVCGMVQKLDAINSPIVYVFLSSNFLHKNLYLNLVNKLNANCNNKLSIQLVRSLLIEEDPAQSRREPQASDETGSDRGVKQQISGPFLPRMLHPEYGTPKSFAEDRWPTAPRPGSYLHRSCRLSFPLAGIGGSGRCGSQWYLFHRKYTDA